MGKLEQAVVDYLEQYGQPQTIQAIGDHLASRGFKDTSYDWYTIESMVDDKAIKHVDGGVDGRGEKIKLYAPLNFKG